MQNHNRTCGILLHITSLPGPEGIGTLGKEARNFIDFLHRTDQKIWQILPLGPTGFGNSPYQCYSAFAGNPLLIDIEELVADGLLNRIDMEIKPNFPLYRVPFKEVELWKEPLLHKAFGNFKSSSKLQDEYYAFLDRHAWWLNDYALYMSAKKHFEGKSWNEWENGLKFRAYESVKKYTELLKKDINFQKFIQFIFFRQWFQLKQYANSNNVQIFGDVPLYVSGDSVDVWANTRIFKLDMHLNQSEMGGVPPDYFSETGQLWGNPVFDWEHLEERKFDWWIARLHFNLDLFDLVRIDHFRGLESYWSIPAGESTAINGRWVSAKGHQLLKKFQKQIGNLPLVAEDLGIITEEVEHLRNSFNLPGMKVLQFGFAEDPANLNLPHNYNLNFIAYTGTHDNNTTLGWLRSLDGDEKRMVRKYFGTTGRKGVRIAIEQVWASCARSAIIPMQDLLELDEGSRLNTPGTSLGNWEWRFKWWQLRKKHIEFLRNITWKYNR